MQIKTTLKFHLNSAVRKSDQPRFYQQQLDSSNVVHMHLGSYLVLSKEK